MRKREADRAAHQVALRVVERWKTERSRCDPQQSGPPSLGERRLDIYCPVDDEIRGIVARNWPRLLAKGSAGRRLMWRTSPTGSTSGAQVMRRSFLDRAGFRRRDRLAASLHHLMFLGCEPGASNHKQFSRWRRADCWRVGA